MASGMYRPATCDFQSRGISFLGPRRTVAFRRSRVVNATEIYHTDVALANDAALARDLSRNDRVVHNDATPSERLLQSFKTIRSLSLDLEKKQMSNEVKAKQLDERAKLVAKGDHDMTALLRDDGVSRYLAAVVDTHPLFETKEVTVPNWVTTNVLGLSGGVRCYFYSENKVLTTRNR